MEWTIRVNLSAEEAIAMRRNRFDKMYDIGIGTTIVDFRGGGIIPYYFPHYSELHQNI